MFLRRREAAADEVAVSVAAAVPLPNDQPPAGVDHTEHWCQAAATQRAALTAAAREAEATAAFVEQGIVGLAQRFTDLAAQASAQSARVGLLLAHSDRIEAAGESVSMAELTALMQDSLRQLIDRGAGISGHAATLAQALGSVGERVRRIDGCTAELDRINQQMRMLSLNATIEAARAGEAGRGFTVVANEVRQLSQQTQRLSQQMQAETGSIAASVREGGTLVDAVRDVDMSGSLATQDRLAGLLAGLLRRREEIDAVMQESARDSAALAADIAAIVTGLQFQDRSTQRLQHVVAMLDAAMHLLQQTAAETSGSHAPAPPDRAWLEQQLLARFTMGEVRDRARVVLGLGGPVAAAAAQAEGEMELL